MSLLALALSVAPQVTPPPVPETGHASFHPTTFARFAPGPGSGSGSGPTESGSCGPLVNGGFQGTLFGWDVEVSSAGVPGTVEAVGGACTLSENGSFLTSISQGICVPPGATALSFDLVSTSFDGTAGGFPDAFEVSLLDGAMLPVVPTWSPAATSFFNVQEDGSFLSAGAVTATPEPGVLARVRLDLAGLAPGLATYSDLRLYFDLIGADIDFTGSVTVDNVFIEDETPGTVFCEGISCPCGNDSPGTGCANSTGSGGLLVASGSASLAAADLTLEASGLPINYAVFILAIDETCAVLGDGLVAVQPGLYQTGVLRGAVRLVDPAGVVTLGPDAIGTIESNMGMPGLVQAGTTWHFQVAYRDEPSSPCGSRFNLTNGLRVTFAD